MDLFKAMGISASGLNSQRVMINSISMNLANVHTTRTEEGGPYRRKRTVLSAIPFDQPFAGMLSHRIEMTGHLTRTHTDHFPLGEMLSRKVDLEKGGVSAEMIEDWNEPKMIYDPTHPDADEYGYVRSPNINLIEEMIDLMGAVRSYEANVTAFNAAKNMALKALEIGR
jgi:flagellar basal-body rod protein FlgC